MIDDVGENLPLDIQDLGRIKRYDRVGLSLLDDSYLSRAPFQHHVLLEVMIAKNLTFVEMRDLQLLAVCRAFVVARLLVCQPQHRSLNLILPTHTLNIFDLVLQGDQKILNKVNGANDCETAICHKVKVLAQIALLYNAGVGEDCFVLAHQNEFH